MVGRSACASTQREIELGPVRAHMRPCKGRVGRIYCATLGYVGLPLTRKRRGNSTGAVMRVPTEDTGKVTEVPPPGRIRRDIITGSA